MEIFNFLLEVHVFKSYFPLSFFFSLFWFTQHMTLIATLTLRTLFWILAVLSTLDKWTSKDKKDLRSMFLKVLIL